MIVVKQVGIEEIEKVVDDLERRIATGERFSRKEARSRICEQVEEEVLIDCGSMFEE